MLSKQVVRNVIRFYLITLLAICGFAISKAYANAPIKTSSLSHHVAKVCTANCVDPNLLLFALHEAVADYDKVDPNIMLAILQVESSYQTKAVNRSNGKSVGLAQIQVHWHKDKFRTRNYSDVIDNVRVGTQIYQDCYIRHKGSRAKALWCFNGHQKHGMAKYVPKVMKAYAEIKQLKLFV
jgi:soluble lytic murein transglycosylase-like protein